MSFGIVQSAIATMKSNRSLLSKRERLQNTLSGSENEKPEYDLPKSTPETLKRIQEKIKRENKLRLKKRLVIITVVMICLILFLLYFNLNFLDYAFR